MQKNVIYLPNPNHPSGLSSHKIPPDSIYFIDKEYPDCKTCWRKYLEPLGCLFCKAFNETYLRYKGQNYLKIRAKESKPVYKTTVQLPTPV